MVATSNESPDLQPRPTGQDAGTKQAELLHELEERFLQKVADRLVAGDRPAPQQPTEEPARFRITLPREMPQFVQAAGSLFLIAGAGLYAAIRFGQQVFYSRFGVRPEEVGLTYASSVSRAAVAIVALLTGLAFFLAVQVLRHKLMERIPRRRRVARAVLSLTLFVVAGIALVTLFWFLGETPVLVAIQLSMFAILVTWLWDAIKDVAEGLGLEALRRRMQGDGEGRVSGSQWLTTALVRPTRLLILLLLLVRGAGSQWVHRERDRQQGAGRDHRDAR